MKKKRNAFILDYLKNLLGFFAMSKKIKAEMDEAKTPRVVTSLRLHPVLKKHLKKIAKKKQTSIGKLIEAYILAGLSKK